MPYLLCSMKRRTADFPHKRPTTRTQNFSLRLASICFVNSFDRNVSNHKSNSLNFWSETFCGFIFVWPKIHAYAHMHTHKGREEKDIINTKTIPCYGMPCPAMLLEWKKINSSGSWHKAAMCRTVIGVLLFSIVKVLHQSYCFIYHLLSGNSIENVKSFMKMYANFFFCTKKKMNWHLKFDVDKCIRRKYTLLRIGFPLFTIWNSIEKFTSIPSFKIFLWKSIEIPMYMKIQRAFICDISGETKKIALPWKRIQLIHNNLVWHNNPEKESIVESVPQIQWTNEHWT